MENKIADKNQISTTLSSVIINRRDPNSPITETDLENYSVESVWRLFSRHREVMAKDLGISELDVFLIEAKLIGIKVDGYKVINPEGFTGKEMEISILMTIGAKQFNAIKFANNADLGSVSAFMLREREGEKDLVYAEVGGSKTKVFVSTPIESKMRGEISWGSSNVIDQIGDIFGSKPAISKMILKRVEGGDVSDAVSYKAGRVIQEEIKAFVFAISKLVLAGKSSISNIFISSKEMAPHVDGRKFLFMGKRVKITGEVAMPVSEFVANKDNLYRRFNEVIRQRIRWASAIN